MQRTRRIILFLFALLLGVVVVFFAAMQGRAWYYYRAAQSALSQYHFAQARTYLAIPLQTWPSSCSVRLLAARAARLDGAAAEAREHLLVCQQQQPNANAVLMEWALLRAQAGELEAVESYLHDQLRRGSDQADLIQEALIEGYARTYRIGPALAGVEDWLQRSPDDTQALYLRGSIYQQVQRPQSALGSYRRTVELDPQRDDARRRLTQCLVRLGLYDEANRHLEYLHRRYPENMAINILLAGTRFREGRVNEARKLLDSILAQDPDNEPALRERGRLALTGENAAEAEKWLRQAERHNPHDALLLPLLAAALEQQGKQDEAEKLHERIKQNERDFQRLAQISLHDLGERPNDHALHREFGELLLRLGYQEAGRNWLLLAENEDRASSPTGDR